MKNKLYIAAILILLTGGFAIGVNSRSSEGSKTIETVKSNPVAPQETALPADTDEDQPAVEPAPSTRPKLYGANVVGVPHSTPAPVTDQSVPTVQSFREIPVDSLSTDCEYTYTDGTTKRFSWYVIYPQGGWEEDSMGNNGHYIQTSSRTGTCDASIVGTPKS